MKGLSWPRALRGRWFLPLLVACAVGAACLIWSALDGRSSNPIGRDAAVAASSPQSESSARAAGSGLITLPQKAWDRVGLKLAPAVMGHLSRPTWVTGEITLNEDRVAHIYPLVSGRVEEVLVHFGDHVEAGEVLVLVHSKKVGQTKLELFKSRHDLEFANLKLEWRRKINKNTQDLIAALEKGVAVEKIEEQFRNRPMGDYRQQLLSSYASFLKAQADFTRLKPLAEKGVIPGKNLLTAKATLDAQRATFRAWMEQIKFDARRQATFAEHERHNAQVKMIVNETALKILGYDQAAIAEIDPTTQGSALAHHSITAPFDGTVISKDVALLERIEPTKQILRVADLSTVWIAANIYQKDLPLLNGLEGQTIRFRSVSYPDRDFQARVFFTGELVDQASRSVRLRALAENSDGLLKPGMFVRIRLPAKESANVLQVPLSAVQRFGEGHFVFVHRGGGSFERRDVEIGRQNDENAQIVAGLKAGESVVVSGGFTLKSMMLAEE